jgi:hypothetical protein
MLNLKNGLNPADHYIIFRPDRTASCDSRSFLPGNGGVEKKNAAVDGDGKLAFHLNAGQTLVGVKFCHRCVGDRFRGEGADQAFLHVAVDLFEFIPDG